MNNLEGELAALRAEIAELKESVEQDQRLNAAVAVFTIETQSKLKILWALIDRRLLAHGGGSEEARRITNDLDASLTKLGESLKARSGGG